MRRVLAAVAVLLVIAAFLPLWPTDRWWVRILDFPTLQLAAIGIVVLILYGVTAPNWRRGRFLFIMAMLGITTGFQLVHAVPFLAPWPDDMAGVERCPAERRLTLLGANVLTENEDYGKLLSLVRRVDPDLVLLTESNREWGRAMRPIHADYPHRLARPLDNTYGMHFYSRLPFDGRIFDRVKPDIPSIEARVTLRDGSVVTFHGLHPEPPLPGDDSGERDAELVMVGRDIRDDGRAAIVFGDMNDVAWSDTSQLFREVSGMRDPRIGRRLMPTYHAEYPVFRWPLDHLFASPHWSLLDMQRGSEIGSDHFPVIFSLCLTEKADRRLVAPSADAEAEADATEQIEEGLDERGDGEK